MKQKYIEKRFSAESCNLIHVINDIVDDYQAEGYTLTTRQVYYQLVARDIIENTLNSYKRIAGLINDGKLAGAIDWDALEDRTREFKTRAHWDDPADIIMASANQYHEDLWENQEHRVFVIIEKEALVGVLEKLCHRYDVPLLAARGYPSGTVLREFAQNHLLPNMTRSVFCKILHLGDHDPSGIDMTRDLKDRLDMFSEIYSGSIHVHRIALNMNQIEEIKPPENPAKSTDARFAGYRALYGTSSWELDALTPSYLNNLVEDHIKNYIDEFHWEQKVEKISKIQKRIKNFADEFDNREN
ncbi:hypothetical protein AB6G31_16120 [Providencia hangzhouensis]|uniref:hypothetical protein n=1 Tax=Providencia hangzhouensis TaxID=3031799 RepID=UPI0034DD562D